MTLERKDIRAKLTPDMHAALAVLAEVDRLDVGEWIERELCRVIVDRVHAANVISRACASKGITGNRREEPGISGSGRE